jgi:GT2 family glycosyltransferase
LVSVVIPTYNRAYCVAATVDSVLAQTHAAIEIILVDDGSTDGTQELILSRYEGPMSKGKLRYARQDNAGAAASRNHALRLARGDFIAFLDSDDIWEPWKIELQLDVLEQFPDAGLVYTDMIALCPDGKIQYASMLREVFDVYRWFPTNDSLFDQSMSLDKISPQWGERFPGKKIYSGDIFSPMLMGCLFLPSSTLMRRALVERIGGFRQDMPIAEDYEFMIRACRETRVAYADVSSTWYQRGRPDQITRPGLHCEMMEMLVKTISKILREDRARVNLTKKMLRARQRELHRDFGECLLDRGRNVEAAKQLSTSLCYQPFEARAIGLLALSFLPKRATSKIRRAYRHAKSGIFRD